MSDYRRASPAASSPGLPFSTTSASPRWIIGAPCFTTKLCRRCDVRAWCQLHADAVARPHGTDPVELALLAGVVGGALAHLVALVEQLDLLELLEGFRQRRLGVVELALE